MNALGVFSANDSHGTQKDDFHGYQPRIPGLKGSREESASN